MVDTTFNLQTSENAKRFANFPATSKLFLRDGQAPAVGSILRNPDLAATYRLIAKQGAARVLPRCPRRPDRADRPAPAEGAQRRRCRSHPATWRAERPG